MCIRFLVQFIGQCQPATERIMKKFSDFVGWSGCRLMHDVTPSYENAERNACAYQAISGQVFGSVGPAGYGLECR